MQRKLSSSSNKLIEDNLYLSNKENDKEELNELLKKSPSNISTCLIKISIKNNYKPLNIEKYYENIFSELDKLRRTDGSKYKSKSIKTVRSAIVSNKLFVKQKNNLYALNIKECIKYLKIIQDKMKLNNKKQNKITNKKFNINSDVNEKKDNIFLKKKRNNINDISEQIEKYKHVYELMESILDMYSKDKELNKKIKLYFSKCNNYKEIIVNYKNNDNLIEGILSMFNYFKPFLKNHLFSIEGLNYLNNLNAKIDEFREELNFSKIFCK